MPFLLVTGELAHGSLKPILLARVVQTNDKKRPKCPLLVIWSAKPAQPVSICSNCGTLEPDSAKAICLIPGEVSHVQFPPHRDRRWCRRRRQCSCPCPEAFGGGQHRALRTWPLCFLRQLWPALPHRWRDRRPGTHAHPDTGEPVRPVRHRCPGQYRGRVHRPDRQSGGGPQPEDHEGDPGTLRRARVEPWSRSHSSGHSGG